MAEHIMVNGHKAVVEKGSAQNHGRRIAVYHTKVNGKWTTHSTNLARAKYEEKHGQVSRQFDVDHKDSNHMNDDTSNLQTMKKSDNVAKENKRRAGK